MQMQPLQVDNAPLGQTLAGAEDLTVSKPLEIASFPHVAPLFRARQRPPSEQLRAAAVSRKIDLLLCALYKYASLLSLAKEFSRWHQSFVIA